MGVTSSEQSAQRDGTLTVQEVGGSILLCKGKTEKKMEVQQNKLFSKSVGGLAIKRLVVQICWQAIY